MDIGDGSGTGVPRALSFAQERLWFLDQLRPGSADYLLPLALRIHGQLDVPALVGALNAIVRRHDVLRTRYVTVDGEPAQVVQSHTDIEVARVDLAGDDEDAVAALVASELRRPIDLRTVPPLRATLARTAEDEHLLIVVVHHIAFDFASWTLFGRELAAGYGERAHGTRAEPPASGTRYADFASWQRDRLRGDRLDADLEYWRQRLAGLAPLELPTDRPRPPEWDGAGEIVRFTVPGDVVAAVDRFARENRSTRFMVLLAAFQALLAAYSGQHDLAVGTPVSGRSRVDVESVIGLFVNTVVLRADLSGSPSFRDLLHRVRDGALRDFSRADTPFEHIVTELTPDRDLSRNPLFQVSFTLLNQGEEPVTLPGLRTELMSTPATSIPFDLVLDLIRQPDGRLAGRLAYATALFDADSMTRLVTGYAHLLRTALAEPDVPVLPMARRVDRPYGRERGRLLALGNDTAGRVPDATVTEMFGRQARATPDACALVCAGRTLTYGELDARANQLARHLRARGVGPGSLVGVYLDRGEDLVVALLGVLRTGGAYLALDPLYPTRRVEFMLTDAGADTLISRSAPPGPLARAVGCQVVLDQDRETIAALPRDAVGEFATADDLAYVIYTSGSTGTPKGVLIDHRGLATFLVSMADRLRPQAGEAVVALTTLSFDPSVLELYLPLLVGAHTVLATSDEARDPQRLAGLIAATRPAMLQGTPTALRMLLDSGWTAPPELTVLCGGEKVPVDLVADLSAGGATVWDLYGPTEATVWATTARLDPEGRVLDWSPRANMTVHLLDDRLEPTAEGAVGEVFLGGVGLAWGYQGRPDLTAGLFLPDPHGRQPGGRLYRTGDLARRRADGSLEILGRADHQVKIHGHRIEPGEIEAVLRGHPDVRAAVVHPAPTPDGGRRLVAYLVAHDDRTPLPSTERLRRFALRSLPDYMVPSMFVTLDALPLTASGKADREALPVPADADVCSPRRVMPRTQTERVVADTWREVLGAPRIGVYDDFFDIGGHSLLATRIAVRLRAALGIDVPVRALFDHTTVAALTAALPAYPPMPEHQAMPALTAHRRTGREALVRGGREDST